MSRCAPPARRKAADEISIPPWRAGKRSGRKVRDWRRLRRKNPTRRNLLGTIINACAMRLDGDAVDPQKFLRAGVRLGGTLSRLFRSYVSLRRFRNGPSDFAGFLEPCFNCILDIDKRTVTRKPPPSSSARGSMRT